jgi:methylthioribose-1-phosphate isomerase
MTGSTAEIIGYYYILILGFDNCFMYFVILPVSVFDTDTSEDMSGLERGLLLLIHAAR